MIVTFHGASDDLVEIKAGDKDEEFGAYSSTDGGINRTFDVSTIGHTRVALVHALYGVTGACWCFAVEQLDEDRQLAPWTFTIDQSPDCAYSTRLIIDTGDDLVEVHKKA